MTVPKNYEIFKYWEKWLEENKFISIDSFCCFACKDQYYNVHIPSNLNEVIEDKILESEDIKRIWNKLKGIQKHHIFPKQFGGKDDVDNLFLLCRRCHNNAPILRIFKEDKTLFLKWVKKQSFYVYLSYEIKENIKWLCNNELEIEKFGGWMDNKVLNTGLDIFREAINNSGLHYDSFIYRTRIPISSILANLYFQWQKNPEREKGSE